MPPPPGQTIPLSGSIKTGSESPGSWKRPVILIVSGLRNRTFRTSLPFESRTINEWSSGCLGLKALSGNAWNSFSIIRQIGWLFASRIVAVRRIILSRTPIERNGRPLRALLYPRGPCVTTGGFLIAFNLENIHDALPSVKLK